MKYIWYFHFDVREFLKIHIFVANEDLVLQGFREWKITRPGDFTLIGRGLTFKDWLILVVFSMHREKMEKFHEFVNI